MTRAAIRLRFGFSPEVSRGRIFPSFAAAFAVAARSAPGRNLGEGRDLSPNEMFAACVGITGYVPLPLTGDDYIEFLPASFRTLNDYGLTIDNRTYDCKALNPYRRLDSGLPGGNRKKWEVHYQPYDITIVWLRDHCSDEWFTVPWVYRSAVAALTPVSFASSVVTTLDGWARVRGARPEAGSPAHRN